MHRSLNVPVFDFASRTITGLTGLTSRQEEQLDRRCDRFTAESQPWIGNRGRGAGRGYRVWRKCLAVGETFRLRHQKRMNPCLTAGAADQQTVTD
ncbi:hypothetical protein VZT92_007772 [Zoarces viviparus]|uniref:Uncharacterized protein n=1 Tax=Zoarces viviparus TaxID=48416 RepID=A0AAW1FNX3_ZOAVI